MKHLMTKTSLCIPTPVLTSPEVKIRMRLLSSPKFDELRFNIEKALTIRHRNKVLPKWLLQILREAGQSEEFNIISLEILLLYIGHQSVNANKSIPSDIKLLKGFPTDLLHQLYRSLYRKTLTKVRRKLAVQELLTSTIGDSYFANLIAMNTRYLKCEEVLSWIHKQRTAENRDKLDNLLGALKGDKRKRPPKADVWRCWIEKSLLQLKVRSIREASGVPQINEANKLAKQYGEDVRDYLLAKRISEPEVVNLLLRSRMGDSRHMENEISKLNSAINRMGYTEDELTLIKCWGNVGFSDWGTINSCDFWSDLENLYWTYLIKDSSRTF